MKRKICYITGTRADFGLMESTLKMIHCHSQMSLSLLVTGTHLSERYGKSIQDIEKAGLSIAAQIELDLTEEASGASMSRNIGRMLIGFTDALETLMPDIVLVLGDRGEMLAAALAAIHLNILVAHIHGGERSGSVDEPVRHAISKLAHLHFVSTSQARDRLVKMGERGDSIWVTGAPGLDGLLELACLDRKELFSDIEFRNDKNSALFVYHPVLQDNSSAAEETKMMLETLMAEGFQTLALVPNSDAGSEEIRNILLERNNLENLRVVTHLPRKTFVSWIKVCDVMVGNSSSGIIEAATFGTPVINIGSRQNLRERNLNVIDVVPEYESFRTGLQDALSAGKYPKNNIYGDGGASRRILSILADHELPSSLKSKVNVY